MFCSISLITGPLYFNSHIIQNLQGLSHDEVCRIGGGEPIGQEDPGSIIQVKALLHEDMDVIFSMDKSGQGQRGLIAQLHPFL